MEDAREHRVAHRAAGQSDAGQADCGAAQPYGYQIDEGAHVDTAARG